MNILELIDKKRLKKELSYQELEYIVNNYLNGTIPDYQMSSLLMAITLNGMSDEETINLTDIMIRSGDTIDLSVVDGIVVDKHSTGGIGDKTTLILAPLVAASGVRVAKMSGRGLGFTGGTIDKLESIEGFNVEMSFGKFINQVNDIGISIVSQMGNLVPADKKIYALRDITGTVASIPLIASSIMSKKIASGADSIVIDVKVGNGALVNNIEDARKLANIMIRIGKEYNKKVVCVVTDMNRPLGRAIGNSIEVMEAINTLRCKGPEDVNELVITLGSYMVSLGLQISINDAKKIVTEKLKDGSALKKFFEFVKAQGGNIDTLNVSKTVISIKSSKTGFIKSIDAYNLGNIVKEIGGGREKKGDKIDYGVGILLYKQIGDYVLKDEELAKVYINEIDLDVNRLVDCFEIANEVGEIPKLIKEIIK